MDICSKNNLSKMEQSELLKLVNDRTIIIKPADKGGTVVVLSTEHCKTMIMQHLNDSSTYKKLDLNTDIKIYTNFKIFSHKPGLEISALKGNELSFPSFYVCGNEGTGNRFR